MKNRPGRTRFFLPLLLLAAALLPGTAAATTGPTPLAHPPRFNVTEAEAAPYLGRFAMVQPSSRQLISGAYVAGYNERHFVEGSIELYTYDAEGREMVVLGRTYEYRSVGDRMEIDIISPENQVILARMRLHPVDGGKLTGEVSFLVPPGKPEQISFGPAPEPSPEAEPESTPEPEAEAPAGATAAAPSQVAAIVVRAVRQIFGF